MTADRPLLLFNIWRLRKSTRPRRVFGFRKVELALPRFTVTALMRGKSISYLFSPASANLTSSETLRASSFAIRRALWTSTVRALMFRDAAISLA